MKKALFAGAALLLAATSFASSPVIDGSSVGDDGYTVGAVQTVAGSFGTAALQLYNISYDNDNTNLYIHVGGAFRTTGQTTGWWIFIDSAAGETETVDCTGATSGFFLGQSGVVMETGTTPDFLIGANNGAAAGTYTLSHFAMGTDTETLWGTFDAVAGSFTADGGAPAGIAADCDNSAPLNGSATASAVTTGYELQIPLSLIGSPTLPASINVLAAAGDGANGYYSNQTLAGSNTTEQLGGGNGNGSFANFQTNTQGAFGGTSGFSGTQTMVWNLTDVSAVNDWTLYN